MGFPTDMFPVLFTIPRVAGWIAHWVEYQSDNENNIVRPRQNYQGHGRREWVPMSERKGGNWDLASSESGTNRRRNVQA